MNHDTTVTEILHITSPGARIVMGLFVGVTLILALTNLGDVHSPTPTLLAVLLVTAAAVLVTARAEEPFPATRSALLLFLVAASTALVTWNLPSGEIYGYSAWHLGANTLVLLILGLRGRSGLAWLGFTIMIALTAAWTLTAGANTLSLLSLLPNQLGTLLVGTLFAIGLRRTSRTITELHAEQAALASAESATRAAAIERARQAANLNAIARPALDRIARGAPYTESEREEWMRLEAAVRDRLRAPALDSAALAAAANDARERGVEVTLLDDSSGGLESPVEREVVASAIIDQLSTMKRGRLIGRVLPRGRGSIATILVDDGESTKRTDVG